MEAKGPQAFFVELLRQVAPANVNLADEVGHVLGISADSAYRRLRCETEFTISETLKLCNHLDIPLEMLNAQLSGAVTFKTNKMSSDKNSFTEYLEGLLKDLSWMSKYENVEIIYAAEDLPVFYHFFFPVLARFKMCYWTKSILNVPEMQGLKIEDVQLPDNWKPIADNISQLFMRVKTTEIWNDDTVKSTCQQIRFYWEAGFFREKQTALDVVDQFAELLKMVHSQAEMGHKMDHAKGTYMPAEYILYASDLMLGNNCVILKADNKQASYIGYNTFNYMRTTNRFFNEQAETWIDNIIMKANPVSKVSEKQRNQFFKNSMGQIDALRKLIAED